MTMSALKFKIIFPQIDWFAWWWWSLNLRRERKRNDLNAHYFGKVTQLTRWMMTSVTENMMFAFDRKAVKPENWSSISSLKCSLCQIQKHFRLKFVSFDGHIVVENTVKYYVNNTEWRLSDMIWYLQFSLSLTFLRNDNAFQIIFDLSDLRRFPRRNSPYDKQ